MLCIKRSPSLPSQRYKCRDLAPVNAMVASSTARDLHEWMSMQLLGSIAYSLYIIPWIR